MKVGKKIKALMLSVCLLLGLCTVPVTVRAEYGDNAYAFMTQLQSNYPYRAVNSSNGMLAGAVDWLKAQIVTMGYEYMSQPFSRVAKDGVAYSGENLIFSKEGASDRVIVIGAHYDCVQQTFGADDNASGVGVLLELAGIYSSKETPYTLRFILFSAEEPGCLGSQHYVENLSQEERDRIVCMINIDTIASGDYLYLYGGAVDESGSIVRDWAVYQALSAAELLGLPMSFHPDVNENFPSPTKTTASDQMAFSNAGIPYIYCEASNWNGEPYTNFYQTGNEAVAGGTVMHVPEYDNLTFLNNTFGTRVYDHLQAYCRLLDYLIEHLEEGSYLAEFPFEETKAAAVTTDSVYLRQQPTRYSQALELLDAGAELTVTGYHDSWCRVNAAGTEGYIKTEYLEIGPEEETEEETETEEAQTEEETETAASEAASSEEQTSAKAEASEERSSETVISQTASRENPGAQSGFSFDSLMETIQNDPMTLRIILIALIVILCIWLCVLIALRRRKHLQQEEAREAKRNVYPAGEDPVQMTEDDRDEEPDLLVPDDDYDDSAPDYEDEAYDTYEEEDESWEEDTSGFDNPDKNE